MTPCVFCSIIKGEAGATILHEDRLVLAWEDINPVAPLHALVVPRRHYQAVHEIDQAELLARMFEVAHQVAASKGVAGRGYRLVLNTGRDAMQSIPHVHLHVLGGRPMRWPPG